jgi:hypothetical protein
MSNLYIRHRQNVNSSIPRPEGLAILRPELSPRRLYEGQLRNVAFGDMINMVEGFGFWLGRVSGSHHIFIHPAVQELVNLQFLRLVERYNLKPLATGQ